MTRKLPESRKTASGGRHEATKATTPAEPPAVPADLVAESGEPATADPWLSALERDTDKALRAMAEGNVGEAVQWLALAMRSMATHMPGVRQVADEIRTRRLAVVDATGKARVLVASEGAELLQAFRPDGEPALELYVPERDYSASVHLRIGSDDGVTATLSGGGSDAGLEVSHDQEVMASLGTSKMTSPSLTLTDHSGAKIKAGFGDGAELVMQDADDDARLTVDCANGSATVGVFREGTGAELLVTEKSGATIGVWAKGGHGYELHAAAGGPVVHQGRSVSHRER